VPVFDGREEDLPTQRQRFAPFHISARCGAAGGRQGLPRG
jgi:hypothetical protein